MTHPNPNPQPYEWDFDGACKPNGKDYSGYRTFSLGIFQWIPRASGKGLKRGKVVERVRGSFAFSNDAYQEAQRIIEKRSDCEGIHGLL